MYNSRKQSLAAQRFAERREREDRAPRLRSEIPNLASLSLSIEERSSSDSVGQPKHVRKIVVERAPALFFVPCGDPRCEEGGHDVTADIMRALRRGQGKFEGKDECRGSVVGGNRCTRILSFEAVAEYSSNATRADNT
jgi:hypothetical protein